MNITDLLSTIVKGIVKNKEVVLVKVLDEQEEYLIIEVIVDKDDYGIVIGKNGKMINSIKRVIDAATIINDCKKVRINIDKI